MVKAIFLSIIYGQLYDRTQTLAIHPATGIYFKTFILKRKYSRFISDLYHSHKIEKFISASFITLHVNWSFWSSLSNTPELGVTFPSFLPASFLPVEW